jgi:hypothetical protein
MLNTLDTVIAFAVIMTILSLLITIVVQMVSTTLSLRGKNLANALALTFQTIDPKIGEFAHSLAAQILRDPIFSDSIFRPKNRPPVVPGEKAQELIDLEKEAKAAQKQFAADPKNTDKKSAAEAAKAKLTDKKFAVINAEEKLKSAEQELAADPKNADKKTAVETARAELGRAKAELQIPEVTPNRMKPWGVFSKLRDATALGSAIRPGEIYRLLHEIAGLTETEAAVRDIPSELVQKSVALLNCLKDQDEPAQESKAKLEAIRKVADIFSTPEQQKAVLDSLANFGATVERATTEAYDRFQRWFGSAQDRAEQWFQTHVRIVTIVCSICAAFILQLDTAEIFQKLRDQPRLAEALVKAAPGVVATGGGIVAPSDAQVSEEAQKKAFADLRKKLDEAGFDLVPDPFWGRWKAEELPKWTDWCGIRFIPKYFFHVSWHFVGILATAALLTLGAPFWFNLLKNLMSLRPALATLIEKRPTSAPALPPAPSSPPSPS